MKASDLFKELGLGDSDMESAREWVNYKHFSETVPDVLTLNEYVDTVYKKTVTMDAKPHTWFSERYMSEKYLQSNVSIGSEYISDLEKRIVKILQNGKTYELHIEKFLELCLGVVRKSELALPKEALVYLNEIYKGKH
jgi:hypothetical protein|tara:strand:+ start:324 stop:737 length:414 start_codon:yes stop_codon:yes gene_type:complete